MIGCARLKDGPHYLEESKEQSSTKNKLLVSLFSESSSFNKEKKNGVGIFILVILHSILLESCSQFYSKEFVLKISNLRCVNLPSINVMFSNKQ